MAGQRLAGKVALITGATGGIGAATAELFAREGAQLVITGIVDWPGVEDTREDAWDRVIEVNQKGTWLGMKAAMPLLRASGNVSVINTSSVLGLVGSGAAAAYQASKGAVRLLSKTAAVEYARQGVRVNSVHPGVIATPMIQDLLDEQGDQQPDIQRTPMRRSGRADEVAPAFLFLACGDSSFVTGSELVVDGGLTAY
jgi:3alpha(or 20beta)-hydroxysteroid dehydrogenase